MISDKVANVGNVASYDELQDRMGTIQKEFKSLEKIVFSLNGGADRTLTKHKNPKKGVKKYKYLGLTSYGWQEGGTIADPNTIISGLALLLNDDGYRGRLRGNGVLLDRARIEGGEISGYGRAEDRTRVMKGGKILGNTCIKGNVKVITETYGVQETFSTQEELNAYLVPFERNRLMVEASKARRLNLQ